MANPYDVLGVKKTATDDEIRAAYRKLAKANHPDLNPGNKDAESRFKEIASANAIIGDADKRKRYDAGEIDETGAEKPPEREFYRSYAEQGGPGFRYEAGGDGADFDDLGGFFSEMFRQSGGQARGGSAGGARFTARGQDVRYKLEIDFLEAVNGAKKRVDLPDGRTIDVTVPAGVSDGQQLRLTGLGGPGTGGGPAGNAIVEIAIRPHAVFRREGTTIRSVLPVTLKEALAGGRVRVETVTGPIELKIPAWSSSGSVLRLRGKGVADQKSGVRGDHLVELSVMLPDQPDDELRRLVTEWEDKHPYDPRNKMGAR